MKHRDVVESVLLFLDYPEVAVNGRVNKLWYEVASLRLASPTVPGPIPISKFIIDKYIPTRFLLWQMYHALVAILKDFDIYSGEEGNLWFQNRYPFLNTLFTEDRRWHFAFRSRITRMFRGIIFDGLWVSYIDCGADMIILYKILTYIRHEEYISKYPQLFPPEVQNDMSLQQTFSSDAQTFPPEKYMLQYPWHYHVRWSDKDVLQHFNEFEGRVTEMMVDFSTGKRTTLSEFFNFELRHNSHSWSDIFKIIMIYHDLYTSSTIPIDHETDPSYLRPENWLVQISRLFTKGIVQ